MELLSQQTVADIMGAIGISNSFVLLLLQSIIASQYRLLPNDFWPKDSGPTIKNVKSNSQLQFSSHAY
jgi:hypothetical protein